MCECADFKKIGFTIKWHGRAYYAGNSNSKERKSE